MKIGCANPSKDASFLIYASPFQALFQAERFLLPTASTFKNK